MPLAPRAKTYLPWPLRRRLGFPPFSIQSSHGLRPDSIRGGLPLGWCVLDRTYGSGLGQLSARCNDQAEAGGPSAERCWGAMTMLEISQEVRDPEFGVTVLGQFRLLRGMNVVRVPRASQRLLAFLALHGRIVERAALAGALWPEASEPHAYSSLRAALTRLQRTARMAVAASQLELGLAEGVTVDIHHAKALARRLLDPAVPPAPGDLGTQRRHGLVGRPAARLVRRLGAGGGGGLAAASPACPGSTRWPSHGGRTLG